MDKEGQGIGENAEAHPGEQEHGLDHKDWTAVLRRLGGGSPGSDENLQLADRFRMVRFPARREDVLGRIREASEFHIREGITVDLKHAVEACRKQEFRNVNDLIDCVKDELRRMETAQHQRV